MEEKITKKIFMSICCIALGVVLALSVTVNFAVVIIALLAFFTCMLLIMKTSFAEDRNFLIKIFIIGFALRFILSIFFYSFSVVKGGDGFLFEDDGIDASYNGWEITKLWRSGDFPDEFAIRSVCPSTRLGPYHYWNAFIYYFTGWNPLLLFYFNCLTGALTITLVYSIAKDIFGNRIAFISSLFYTFLPSTLFWSTMNSKDPLTILFLCIFVLSYIRLKKAFSFKYIFLALLALFLVNRLRATVSCILILATALSLIVDNFRYIKKVILMVAPLLILAIFVLWRNHFKLFTWHHWGFGFEKESFFEVMNYLRNVRAEGGSAFFPGINISTPLRTLLFLPLSMFTVLFRPFPWEVRSLFQFMSAFEMIIWYLMVFFIAKGILASMRYKLKDISLMLIFCIVLLITLSLFEGNLGTVFRHRTFAMPFCLIFAAFGWFGDLRYIRKQGLA